MGNGKSFESEDRIRFFIGDVRDRDRLYRALDGVDYVVLPQQQRSCNRRIQPFECIKPIFTGQ